jgi:hypothetical protein
MPSTMPSTTELIVEGVTRAGYLIDLNVSKWSGQARLTEADLGLEGITDSDLHRLGRRQLVPSEEIAAIAKFDSRARAALTAVSYEFPLGHARFVPTKLLGKLLADLDVIRSEFNAKVADFCARYAELSAQVKAEYATWADKVQVELHKDEGWRAMFNARLESAYPDVEKVRKCFGLEWALYQFALPAGLSAKVIQADDALRVARLAEEARLKVEAQVQGFIGEAATELRRRCGELCQHVATQVTKSGEKVSEKTLQPLRDLIAQFKDMDFTGDADFGATLDSLSSEWLKGKDNGVAKELRADEDYRVSMSNALEAVAEKAVGDAQRAAAEAVERFVKFGSYGRAVVRDDDAPVGVVEMAQDVRNAQEA